MRVSRPHLENRAFLLPKDFDSFGECRDCRPAVGVEYSAPPSPQGDVLAHILDDVVDGTLFVDNEPQRQALLRVL